MVRTSYGFLVLALTIWAPASQALAQTDVTVYAAPTSEQMVSETPSVQEPTGKKPLEVGFTWSLGIGVPIVLDVPRDVVRPGANLFFFAGADFGFFVIGGDFGLQWNPIDLNNANIVGVTGRQPLTRFYLSVPEVRFQVPDLGVVLPYASFAFDINFWNFAETQVQCGYWYCANVSVYRFTPGFTGKAGVGIQVRDSGVYIDLGFQYSFTGKGNFFEETGWWLSPYAGVIVRRRD